MTSLLDRIPKPGPRSGSRPSKPVVGLDIEPGFVSAARVSVNGAVSVEQAAGLPLGGDVLREGEVVDPESLAETLRTLFKENDFDRRVRMGMASQRAVLRTLELPPITDRRELAAAVRFQAEDQVPMPLAGAVLDFHPLGVVDTPAGPRLRVVLVAAQRDLVERLLSAARLAGLRPEGVDLSAFALIRSLAPLAGGDDESVVYLAVGGLSNMAVARGSLCVFTRVLGGGLEAMATEIAERRAIGLAEARALILRTGVDPELPAPRRATRAGSSGAAEAYEEAPVVISEPAVEDEIRGVVAAGVREIAVEVRNSLDFHIAQGAEQLPERIVLSGAALEVPGFAERLEAELDMSVTRGEVPVLKASALAGVSAGRLAVAAGLAIEEAPR